MPVREALRQLETEGLVHTRPHSGSVVATLSRDELEELYAMRAALEGLAARIAASAVRNEQRPELQARLDALAAAAAAGELAGTVAADRAFHAGIYAAAGRPRLQERIGDLALNTRRVGMLAYADWRTDPSRGVAAHRAILDAVLAGDADLAERLTTEHVRYGGRQILAAIDALGARD
jgi:DNA-binding GntR family transcriptional regulator